MRITINGKPVEGLTPKIEKSLMLSRQVETADGAVLTPDAAINAFLARTRLWFTIVGGIGVAIMVAIGVAGALGDPVDGPVVVLAAVSMIALLFLFLWWLLQRRTRTFTATLETRRLGLPPVGTRIAIDEEALTVGAERLAWTGLSIETAELSRASMASGDTSETVHIAERLTLTDAHQSVTLDREMIGNGQVLLDNVWRRLRAKG